jgi:hypothetical protein
MPNKKLNMINEIIANFDFEKVNTTMKLLDWQWAGEGVPGINKLRDSATERLNNAIEIVLSTDNKEHHDVGWLSSSGGLKATAWKNKKGKLSKLLLEFVLTDWDAE